MEIIKIIIKKKKTRSRRRRIEEGSWV